MACHPKLRRNRIQPPYALARFGRHPPLLRSVGWRRIGNSKQTFLGRGWRLFADPGGPSAQPGLSTSGRIASNRDRAAAITWPTSASRTPTLGSPRYPASSSAIGPRVHPITADQHAAIRAAAKATARQFRKRRLGAAHAAVHEGGGLLAEFRSEFPRTGGGFDERRCRHGNGCVRTGRATVHHRRRIRYKPVDTI